jgi:hypothetical protein
VIVVVALLLLVVLALAVVIRLQFQLMQQFEALHQAFEEARAPVEQIETTQEDPMFRTLSD